MSLEAYTLPIVSNIKGRRKRKRRVRNKEAKRGWNWKQVRDREHAGDRNSFNSALKSENVAELPPWRELDARSETALDVPIPAWERIRSLPRARRWKHAFLYSRLQFAQDTYEARGNSQYYGTLYSGFLGTMLGERYYLKIIQEAIELGIVERKACKRYAYHGDVFCVPAKFRLSKNYRDVETVRLVLRNPSLVRKLRDDSLKWLKKAIGGNESRRWIWETIAEHTTIDSELALEEYERRKPNASKHARQCYERSVRRVVEKDFYFKRDIRHGTGRLSTSISQLSKIARPFLRIDGEETVELDIGCSQPSLSTTIYPSDCLEKDRLVRTIQSENLYWYLERFSEYKYSKERYKDLKEAFYGQVFYCRNGREHEKPLWQVYDDHFPRHANLITEEKASDNRAFALRMQKTEATLMVDCVVRRLRQMVIRCHTVHDSLIVKESQKGDTQTVLEEELYKLLGFVPRITFKSRRDLL